MVAELSSISSTAVKKKTSSGTLSNLVGDEAVGGVDISTRRIPRWIEAATREPIYSILDGEYERSDNPKFKDVVLITAVSKNLPDNLKNSPGEEISSQKEKYEEEDEENSHPLYSVIQKKKPDSQLEVHSKQEELRKWLQIASNQIPPSRFYSRSTEMYSSEYDNHQKPKENWKRPISSPRGLVGLVGPYRVNQNSSERREYILQEEELVEENVDSISQIPSREVRDEEELHEEGHRRAKWRIRDEDEETLVPDLMIRNLADCGGDEDLEIKEDVVEEVARKIKEWRQLEMRNGEASGPVEGIIIGKEERAVDVPEAVDRVTKSPNSSGEIFFQVKN